MLSMAGPTGADAGAVNSKPAFIVVGRMLGVEPCVPSNPPPAVAAIRAAATWIPVGEGVRRTPVDDALMLYQTSVSGPPFEMCRPTLAVSPCRITTERVVAVVCTPCVTTRIGTWMDHFV